MRQASQPPPAQTEQSSTGHDGLRRYLSFFALAMPAFGAIMIAGYLLLFVIGRTSGTRQPESALLLTALGALAAVILALPTRKMLERGQVSGSIIRYAIGFGIFFLLLSIAWQGFLVIAIMGVWLPLVMLFAVLESRRQVLNLAGIAAFFTVLILLADRFRAVEATSVLDPGALPAILLTMFVVVAFVCIAVVTNVVRFRTVARRLTVTFVLVTLLPAVTTILILSIQSFLHDQDLNFQLLNTIATQEITEIEQNVGLIERDMDFVLSDPEGQQILTGLVGSEISSATRPLAQLDAREYFPSMMGKTARLYQEVLVLDLNGKVAYSTNADHARSSFEDQTFYRQALLSPYTSTLTESPQFGDVAFVSARPIIAGSQTIGELVFVSDYSEFSRVVAASRGSGEQRETYLVSESLVPLTHTVHPTDKVETAASMNALHSRQSGTGVYPNYAGRTVLGAYYWIPALRSALITEQDRMQTLLPTVFLVGNILIIGLFAIALSVVAVVFTSRTITAPIEDLASAAQRISSGDLSARADANRLDELGTLAEFFNVMATRLQQTVTNLESRVDERTHDLQRQALRLRAAAEISRDSASAVNLEELLSRSAELISERFGYYHVSIYLLDSNREYLVLSAASGEAGRLMLETGFKLRGGASIVAFVGQTGTARTVPDLSREPPGVRHPLLPGSRSELALPLKNYNVLIGVLDVQSDQANVFGEEDAAALQLMADQLSVAIERTRILQDSESNLRELERSFQRFTRESWRALLRSRESEMIGYAYEGADFHSLTDVPPTLRQALERGEPVMLQGTNGRRGAILAVPIKLRGTTIGALNLTVRDSVVPPETAALAHDISERLAQALEASWLLSDSRARAERERFIAEMSAKIGAAPDVEQILRTTVEELSGLVGNSPITIKLQSAANGTTQEEE